MFPNIATLFLLKANYFVHTPTRAGVLFDVVASAAIQLNREKYEAQRTKYKRKWEVQSSKDEQRPAGPALRTSSFVIRTSYFNLLLLVALRTRQCNNDATTMQQTCNETNQTIDSDRNLRISSTK